MEDESSYVTKCQAGDTVAFGVLYDYYIDKIYRFVYYKTFVKEVAEDITSDVFHKALVKINSFDSSKGVFSAWLYRIARNALKTPLLESKELIFTKAKRKTSLVM